MKRSGFQSYELFLFLLLIGFIGLIGVINPAFFSLGTLFDLIRNQIVYVLFAFALLPVVILGGVDISFVGIAALSGFFTRIVLTNLGYEGGIWLVYLTASAIGMLLGMVVAGLVSSFKLNIFELSLGLVPLIHGFLTLSSAFMHSPRRLVALNGWNMKWLVTVPAAVGRSGLHVSVLVVAAVFISMSVFLRYSVLGRSIYAMGSNRSVAIRTGVDTRKIYFTVFMLMGALAAVAGITSSGLGSGSFEEKYFKIYATIIIGGASIHGGKGSVLGTLLGVLLVGLINQALVYLRIPTAWGDVFLGTIFIIFTIYQTLERRFDGSFKLSNRTRVIK